MTMKLCDWCGEPAFEGSDLCPQCLHAQRLAEEKQANQPQLPAKRPLPIVVAIGNGLILFRRGMVVLFLGTAMVLAGLFGTCSTIAGLFSILNPWMLLLSIAMAAFGFSIAYALYALTKRMLAEPPRLIESTPPQIAPTPLKLIESRGEDSTGEATPSPAESGPAGKSVHGEETAPRKKIGSEDAEHPQESEKD